MTNSGSDHDESDVEFEIAIAYVIQCIDNVQKYYIKSPRCSSILIGKSNVDEVLEENLQVYYDIFRMDVHIFKHLCDELTRLIANRFQHSLETIQRQFRCALRAIHSLGCFIIRPDDNAIELLIIFAEIKNIIHGLRHDTIVEKSANDSRVMQEALGHAKFQFPWPPRDRKGRCKSNVVYASLFEVGAHEALVIGVVALLVFGPKGLAKACGFSVLKWRLLPLALAASKSLFVARSWAADSGYEIRRKMKPSLGSSSMSMEIRNAKAWVWL
ncbi:hypothetical protein SO802_002374 [Lithocarpus litseifolius]|uniref:Uncharacterized protein n=1 Tax=Lithocarpus litseifolius TaxID=425828 RepID=A0AAW2E129_9ROSI